MQHGGSRQTDGGCRAARGRNDKVSSFSTTRSARPLTGGEEAGGAWRWMSVLRCSPGREGPLTRRAVQHMATAQAADEAPGQGDVANLLLMFDPVARAGRWKAHRAGSAR